MRRWRHFRRALILCDRGRAFPGAESGVLLTFPRTSLEGGSPLLEGGASCFGAALSQGLLLGAAASRAVACFPALRSSDDGATGFLTI
jgi:hypothetical protein